MTVPKSSRERDEQQNEKWYQILLFAGGIALFGSVLGLILDWYIEPETSTEKKDLVQALGFITAGVAGAVGVYFTWRNLSQTKKNTEETLQLTEQGQITERFTSAIEQLGETDDKEGKPKLEIRLGGIYALEWIARDSPEKYYATILKFLTAYVRMNAALPSEEASAPQETALPSEEASAPQEKPRDDIQAILDILGERQEDRTPNEHGVRLDLRKTYDVRLDLRETRLIGANLTQAHLQGANLERAHLQGANLYEANLKDAYLQGADFLGASLQGADLQYADLRGANLQGAYLQGDYLQELGVSLRGADLSRAHLEEADLRFARIDQEQLEQAIGDEKTKLPEGFERPKSWIQQASTPTQVKVFETSEQTGWLKVTEKGLEYRLDDRRPGRRSGPRWTLMRGQAKEIRSKHDYLVDPRYKLRSGLFSIGPRKNWLYSKILYPEPALLESKIEQLLEKASA